MFLGDKRTTEAYAVRRIRRLRMREMEAVNLNMVIRHNFGREKKKHINGKEKEGIATNVGSIGMQEMR